MSTAHTIAIQASVDAEYATIEASAAQFLEGRNEKTFITTPGGALQELLTILGAARPLLVAFSLLPIMSRQLRMALNALIGAYDRVEAEEAANPDFKAGKDL